MLDEVDELDADYEEMIQELDSTGSLELGEQDEHQAMGPQVASQLLPAACRADSLGSGSIDYSEDMAGEVSMASNMQRAVTACMHRLGRRMTNMLLHSCKPHSSHSPHTPAAHPWLLSH